MTITDVVRMLSRTEACLWELYDTAEDPTEKEKTWNELIENHETMLRITSLEDETERR